MASVTEAERGMRKNKRPKEKKDGGAGEDACADSEALEGCGSAKTGEIGPGPSPELGTRGREQDMSLEGGTEAGA